MAPEGENKHPSEYTEGREVVAFNQSGYPVLIEVYDVNEDYVTFASNINKLETCNKVKYETSTGRAYFQHYGQKYYLDECMNVGL
jgi:hypothetical protein